MNRPNKDNYTKYFVLENEQYVLRGLKRYLEDLEKYCDELESRLYSPMLKSIFPFIEENENLKKSLNDCEKLEKKLKFRDDILFCIGETLVDESKMNVTTKCAIKRIREYMCRLNDERRYIDE